MSPLAALPHPRGRRCILAAPVRSRGPPLLPRPARADRRRGRRAARSDHPPRDRAPAPSWPPRRRRGRSRSRAAPALRRALARGPPRPARRGRAAAALRAPRRVLAARGPRRARQRPRRARATVRLCPTSAAGAGAPVADRRRPGALSDEADVLRRDEHHPVHSARLCGPAVRPGAAAAVSRREVQRHFQCPCPRSLRPDRTGVARPPVRRCGRHYTRSCNARHPTRPDGERHLAADGNAERAERAGGARSARQFESGCRLDGVVGLPGHAFHA